MTSPDIITPNADPNKNTGVSETGKSKQPNIIARLFEKLLDMLDSDIDETEDLSAGIQLTILYGTQTGNAQIVAEATSERAKALGIDTALRDMQDVDVAMLKDIENLLIITSTFDNGGMPDNAQLLWESVCDPSAPMLNIRYSVLGLGDSSYLNFCQAGKEWDACLEGLGCQRITERVDCDVDYDELAKGWIDTVIPAVARSYNISVSDNVPSQNLTESIYHHNRKNPFVAKLKTKKLLTGDNSTKEIMHYELDITGVDESYEEGDIIHIIPHNRAELVTEILAYFGVLNTESHSESNTDTDIINKLTHDLEIRSPSRELLELLKHKATGNQADILTELLNHKLHDHDALDEYLWGKDSLVLMKSIMGADNTLSLDEFMATCKPLTARAYSISSSMSSVGDEVHMTVRSVRYDPPKTIQNDESSNQYSDKKSEEVRQCNGVASTYLADVLAVGDTVQGYFSHNQSFKLPSDPNTPVIMVGPGTGIAPFRAFLQAREQQVQQQPQKDNQEQLVNNDTQGDNWLFFGERNSQTDYIYQEELESMQASGLLTKLSLAFSRDQSDKLYVQHRMMEEGAELFKWLERGAYFYVCGDALHMAKDVEFTLQKVLEKFGKMGDLKSTDYMDELRKSKRYVKDVY